MRGVEGAGTGRAVWRGRAVLAGWLLCLGCVHTGAGPEAGGAAPTREAAWERTIDLRRDAVGEYAAVWEPVREAFVRCARLALVAAGAADAAAAVAQRVSAALAVDREPQQLRAQLRGEGRSYEVRLWRAPPGAPAQALRVRIATPAAGVEAIEALRFVWEPEGVEIELGLEQGLWRERAQFGTGADYTVRTPELARIVRELETRLLPRLRQAAGTGAR